MKTKVLVIGATGMLGSMVTDVLRRNPSLSVTVTSRDQEIVRKIKNNSYGVECLYLDVQDKTIYDSIKNIVPLFEWIVSCTGKIKPYTHDGNREEIENAIYVNSVFPHVLDNACNETGVNCKVIQIATDCVYSGKDRDYVETSPHDALDVYGKTKSLGEVVSSNFINLRCSIIGPEPKAHVSLLDWFLTQPKNATVNGFTNHLWNGVTTYHFARICEGIIINNKKDLPNLQHIVPKNKMDKYNMLLSFSESFDRRDIKITPVAAATVIDRTLSTLHKDINSELWSLAGYEIIPTIHEMIDELSRFDYRFKEW